MGIAIGEHRLIKEERRAGAGLLGTVLLGRTFTHTNIHTCVLYVLTHTTHAYAHTRTQSLLQASETLRHYVLWRLRQIWPNGFPN